MTSALAIVTLTWPILDRPPSRLVYNMSPSAPVGLYLATETSVTKVGDLVLAWPPVWARKLADERGYLPFSVPLIKRIEAIRGDWVCRVEGKISINGRVLALAAEADRLERPLPRWGGCRALVKHEFFLLMPDGKNSFDSRYFGPVGGSMILARLTPLWVHAVSSNID